MIIFDNWFYVFFIQLSGRNKVESATVVESNWKAPFSISTTLRRREGRYSFSGLIYFFSLYVLSRGVPLRR